MPSPRLSRFRLLADTPLEVAFKDVTYRLELLELPVSGLWQLRASYAGGYWSCVLRSSEADLRKAVFEAGVDLEQATVARTIFERLVKTGRAEIVKG